jgi:class 3 adenylate cyclase
MYFDTMLVLTLLRCGAGLKEMNQRRGLNLQVRIGINTGPVVASYVRDMVSDIWGDTGATPARLYGRSQV